MFELDFIQVRRENSREIEKYDFSAIFRGFIGQFFSFKSML